VAVCAKRACAGRSPARIAVAAIAMGLAGSIGGQVVKAEDARVDASAAEAAHSGIWKAVVPPGVMHGEFDSDDPIGLTAGARIRADCSINWVDPDGGKLYCFSSATSLVYFLDAPHAYLERARAQWSRLTDGAR
jgi:hypothetical protein